MYYKLRPLFEENKYKIVWKILAYNPNAIQLLEAHPDKNEISIRQRVGAVRVSYNQVEINWRRLSGKTNPEAIRVLEANQDKIDWSELSENTAAIRLLEANQDKIVWWKLSRNTSAIHLLKANPNKIDWDILSGNTAAIMLLEANLEKINWYNIWKNPSIFEYDYEAMKQRMERTIGEELIQNRFHPRNIRKFYDWGFEDEKFEEDDEDE